ncbi:MAG: hypothetical protein NZ895_05955 [Archaeoglobaceae archaeon]|nr:hypothetical protein [Archaeoglobaceae archaeon]MDW8014194.1 hypothetical protein [Archaeoglobaceae archaeon]
MKGENRIELKFMSSDPERNLERIEIHGYEAEEFFKLIKENTDDKTWLYPHSKEIAIPL